MVYSEQMAAHGIAPSIGTTGDSYDNAMAESGIGLYKAELIWRQGPWRTHDQLELATLEYVDWFNHRRLHGEIGHVPPARVRRDVRRVQSGGGSQRLKVSTEPRTVQLRPNCSRHAMSRPGRLARQTTRFAAFSVDHPREMLDDRPRRYASPRAWIPAIRVPDALSDSRP